MCVLLAGLAFAACRDEKASVFGSADLNLPSVTIDTSNLEIQGFTLPKGVWIDEQPQRPEGSAAPAGPALAVLHTRAFQVDQGAIVRVVGSRPLGVVASGDIAIAGTLDAGAHGVEPGAGGAIPGAGDGKGETGSNTNDTGGGGAGFGTMGARGGNAGAPSSPGGAGGPEAGDTNLTVLVGGSGGGSGYVNGCLSPPAMDALGGAGGGAIQLFAKGTIRILGSGRIHAGGGGGSGGTNCPVGPTANKGGGGGGGGSGGAIFLQARVVDHAGILAANGGAGGGPGVQSQRGEPGQDGLIGTQPALGGMLATVTGGNGGTRDVAPLAGEDASSGAGGGGGGAVGRIRIVASEMLTGTGISSPNAAQ